ncbi:unnamed protein product, partial [Symbiodinium pilosum]
MNAASSPSCSKALSLHIGQTCLHHRSSCSKVTLLVLAIVGALTKFLDLSPNFALIAFGLQWGFFLLQGWPQRSEVLYDASGSLTHLSIVLAALLSDPVRTPRQTILSIFAVVWCTRLGTFLFNRISQDSKDSRFTDLKTEFWSFSIAWNLQVLWVFLLQLPVMMVNTTLNQPSIGAWDVLGWALWCMGFLVEAVADGQKFAFRGNLANRGRFITSGLWRYSRHPNYFGEILMWIGLCTSFTSCITGIPQLLAWISPAFNAILLVYVSGVPLLEKAGEKKWGQEPEYRHYMEEWVTLKVCAVSNHDKMGPALDLGINLVVFLSLLAIAACIFSLPSKGVSEPTKRSSQHKRLAPELDATPEVPKCIVADSPLEKGQRCTGTVQRYSERNGIGFIACAQCRAVYGRDVQLFQEDWEALDLTIGAVVSFMLSVEERFPCPKGRPWAADVQRVRAQLGSKSYVLGSARLGQLRDSADLARRLCRLSQPALRHQLRARLQADGYLYLRSFLPGDAVRKAHLSLLRKFQRLGLLADGYPVEQARCGACAEMGRLEDLCSEEVLAVLNDRELFCFLDSFLEDLVEVVFDSANLRAVKPGQSTGFHTDSVYMGKLMVPEQPPVLACWIALMPIPLDLGGLVLCRGSNSHPGFQILRRTYGKLDLDDSDIGGTGWFTEDPDEVSKFGGCWETAAYGPGDVVLFTMHTMHGSSVNRTDSWRLSLDFRVQSSRAPPAVSQNKGRWSRLRHDRLEFPRSMEEAKAAWNLEKEPSAKRRLPDLAAGMKHRVIRAAVKM